MADPETAPNDLDRSVPKSLARPDCPLPIRACIQLEDLSQTARTSSIDAAWETLSVAPTQENTFQTVSARPRFETLPGLGVESRPALQAEETEWTTTLDGERLARSATVRSAPRAARASEPRRSGRSSVLSSILAAALSLGLAIFAVLVWNGSTGISGLPSRALSALSVQANSVTALSDTSPPPMTEPSRPLPSTVVLAPETPILPSKAESQPVQAQRTAQPAPRSILASAHSGTQTSAPKLPVTSRYRARKVVATDNPY
jgi:hypothetical protein